MDHNLSDSGSGNVSVQQNVSMDSHQSSGTSTLTNDVSAYTTNASRANQMVNTTFFMQNMHEFVVIHVLYFSWLILYLQLYLNRILPVLEDNMELVSLVPLPVFQRRMYLNSQLLQVNIIKNICYSEWQYFFHLIIFNRTRKSVNWKIFWCIRFIKSAINILNISWTSDSLRRVTTNQAVVPSNASGISWEPLFSSMNLLIVY